MKTATDEFLAVGNADPTRAEFAAQQKISMQSETTNAKSSDVRQNRKAKRENNNPAVSDRHSKSVSNGVLQQRALRSTFGSFATGVTVVTVRSSNALPAGLTANSFTSLSLEPPLVLWALKRSSPSARAFAEANHFAVSILAEGQADISRQFSNSALEDKFADIQTQKGITGAPLIAGAAAHIECELVSTQEAGDHLLFIGKVVAHAAGDLPPLVFHRGHYHLLGEVI
jgi:flavin reductase (DIM6/NTAB) family NADH-FMN oxidoreductase RutF